MDKQWPACFPEGCPPSEAEAKEVLVYRYYKNNPLKSEDFRTYFQLDQKRYASDIYAYGLSVLSSEAACIKGMKLPAQKKYRGYASGSTYEHTGVIMQTGRNPHHITWWLYDGIKPEEFFVICG